MTIAPFYKIGGWESSASEHKAIIRDIFTTPRYAGQFARKAGEHTWMQFKNIHLPQNEQAFGPGSSPDNYISKNLRPEISQFRDSRQQKSIINNTNLVNIHSVTFLLSFLWVGLLWMKKKVPASTLHIYAVILIFLACNAFVTATFANVLERLQNRVSWVLPATNIAVIVSYYAPGFKKKHK
ncbi:MAG: hypothetical protein K8F30_03695 [Taibaiella sp.]|nr:hypothetical protein [Taibaiella sp.]